MPKDLNVNSTVEYKNNFHVLFKEIKKLKDSSCIIKKILDAALEFYDADRAYIFEADHELTMGINTYEVCAEGVEPQIEKLQAVTADIAPRWGEKIKDGESLVISDIEDIKEYCAEYELLKMQDIQTLLAVPFEKNGVTGYVGVDNPKKNNKDESFLQDLSYLILSSLIEYYLKRDLISSTKNENVKAETDIYVKTFGSFKIETYLGSFNEEDITSRLCFIFFAYLLIKSPDVPSINEMAKILWPNQADYEPYDYLRNLVFRTRKMFRNFIGEELIVAKDGTYTCNEKINFITDYEILYNLYQATINNSNEEELLDCYEKISNIYDGDFFPKINSEIWMVPLVEKYKSIYIESVEKYLQILYAKYDFLKMLKICEKAIKIYSDVESFHYYSILAYIGKKKMEVAISYLKKVENMLSEDHISVINEILGVC